MSEMTLSEAVNEAGKWGNLIRALSKVSESAQTILAVEQNIAERTALRDKLLGDTEAAQAKLALELDAVEKARADARALIEGATEEATSIKREARDKANKLVGNAQASAEAAGIERVTYQAERDAARAELESINSQLVEARQVIDKAAATRAALAAVK
jgi:chromosome segregation ATPase